MNPNAALRGFSKPPPETRSDREISPKTPDTLQRAPTSPSFSGGFFTPNSELRTPNFPSPPDRPRRKEWPAPPRADRLARRRGLLFGVRGGHGAGGAFDPDPRLGYRQPRVAEKTQCVRRSQHDEWARSDRSPFPEEKASRPHPQLGFCDDLPPGAGVSSASSSCPGVLTGASTFSWTDSSCSGGSHHQKVVVD